MNEELRDLSELSDEKLYSELLTMKEDVQTELKEANNQLPSSVWETFSSFANTSGGNIVLGVREEEDINSLSGVAHPDKLLTDMWNSMSNENKINCRVLSNSDVKKRVIDGKCFLIFNVKEAPNHRKPIYLKNKLENTYIRTGDGDRKASTDEISAMLRNTSNNADSQVLTGLNMEDLDRNSFQRLKSLIVSRYQNRGLESLGDEDFLIRIGAASRDRKTGEVSLLAGTLLMIGKTNVIKEMFPHFHLDYFEFKKDSPSRWEFRISDDDYLQEEVNLLTFYERVMNRLSSWVKEPFMLNRNMIRLADHGQILGSLREALVNSLIHSDYLMFDASVRIEAREDRLTFRNPGQLLIPASDFFMGGNSKPRNEVLMKLFRMAGFAERQGFGGSQIYSNSVARDLKLPEISSDLTKTELTVFTAPKTLTADVSSDHERIVYQTLFENGQDLFSFSDLKQLTDLSEHYLRRSINSLLDKNLISKQGKGRGVRYRINVSDES